MKKLTLLLTLLLVFVSLSYTQENLKFKKVTYHKNQKVVYFKVTGLDSERHAVQIAELILQQKGVLKIDLNYNSECMAVLDLSTSANDFKKILNSNKLDFDYTTVSEKKQNDLEYPILKGSSEEDKKAYEKALDEWNNRHLKQQ